MDVPVYEFGANWNKERLFLFLLSSWLGFWETELLLGGALILWTTRIVIGPTGFLKAGIRFVIMVETEMEVTEWEPGCSGRVGTACVGWGASMLACWPAEVLKTLPSNHAAQSQIQRNCMHAYRKKNLLACSVNAWETQILFVQISICSRQFALNSVTQCDNIPRQD